LTLEVVPATGDSAVVTDPLWAERPESGSGVACDVPPDDALCADARPAEIAVATATMAMVTAERISNFLGPVIFLNHTFPFR
jgi:hypothetical protein